MKTSTIDEVHNLLEIFFTVDIYNFYILCNANLLLEKLVNTVQLSLNIVYFLLS